MADCFQVYTTTQRRLLDPTAERLENYWWRIWGSRKRELHGATIARLFVEISDGRSFVPLRSARNRDESGGQPVGVIILREAFWTKQEADHLSPPRSGNLQYDQHTFKTG
jgi:hypothetical protein